MPSERTFFNKAIYKRSLSRFWIIGAAYAVVLCFLTLMCGQYFNSEFTEMSEYVSYSILSNLTRREILAAAAAAVVMAVAVYGWMFRKTSAAYISALPVTREALLISSLLAGLTLLILPCIFAMLVSLLLYGGAGSPCTPYLLCSAVAVVLMNIAFFGLASFCTVFTGNAAVLPALYVIALYGFVGIEVVTRYIAEFLLFGVRGTGWELAILSPLYYFFNNYVGSYSYAIPLTAIYAAAGVILAGLAVIFFRRRRMEAAGEVVAVPVLRPIFRWGLAAVGALGMALLILKTVFNVGSGTTALRREWRSCFLPCSSARRSAGSARRRSCAKRCACLTGTGRVSAFSARCSARSSSSPSSMCSALSAISPTWTRSGTPR